ncbi:MAG: nitroreductase family protein [Pseudomonadota bacterium]
MFAKAQLTYEAIPLPDFHRMSDGEMVAAATSFYQFMRTRHSVRQFSDREVPRGIIEDCIRAAGSAPSGANHQPWHFAAISDAEIKRQVRTAAEAEERRFYAGGAGDEWLKALEPIGTNATKPHLEVAPWLIVVFAQRFGYLDTGETYKNYYVPESVGIATGFLLAALHHAGLVSLTHTPNPMKFLNDLLGRPASEKPTMIVAVGHPTEDAVVPAVAKIKKPLDEILTVYETASDGT